MSHVRLDLPVVKSGLREREDRFLFQLQKQPTNLMSHNVNIMSNVLKEEIVNADNSETDIIIKYVFFYSTATSLINIIILYTGQLHVYYTNSFSNYRYVSLEHTCHKQRYVLPTSALITIKQHLINVCNTFY